MYLVQQCISRLLTESRWPKSRSNMMFSKYHQDWYLSCFWFNYMKNYILWYANHSIIKKKKKFIGMNEPLRKCSVFLFQRNYGNFTRWELLHDWDFGWMLLNFPYLTSCCFSLDCKLVETWSRTSFIQHAQTIPKRLLFPMRIDGVHIGQQLHMNKVCHMKKKKACGIIVGCTLVWCCWGMGI